MALSALPKDQSPTCKHLTEQVCRLMKELIRSLSLQQMPLTWEASFSPIIIIIPATGEMERWPG